MCPHLVGRACCALTLIWLRSWARAESACFLRCFPYKPGPESWESAGLLCRVWALELRVILVTGCWGAFLSQLDLDLLIPTLTESEKTPKRFIFLCAIKCHLDKSGPTFVGHENNINIIISGAKLFLSLAAFSIHFIFAS